jgi:hypothetical protein
LKQKIYLIGAVLSVLLLAFAYQGVVRAIKAAIVVAVLFILFKAYRSVMKWRRQRQERLETF